MVSPSGMRPLRLYGSGRARRSRRAGGSRARRARRGARGRVAAVGARGARWSRPGDAPRRSPRSSRGATSATSRWSRSAGGRATRAGRAARAADVIAIALDRLDRIRSFDPLRLADGGRGGRDDGDGRAARPRVRAAVPARPGRGGAVAARRQPRDQRGRPARVQVRRDGALGDWASRRCSRRASWCPSAGRCARTSRGWTCASLLIGSEGTLGIITARVAAAGPGAGARRSWSPRATPSVARRAATRSTRCWAAASCRPRWSTSTGAVAARPRRRRSSRRRARRALLVVCEAESARDRDELLDALGDGAVAPPPAEVWRWREGVSFAVRAARGDKLSEDVAVPVERLREAIEGDDRDRRAPRARGAARGATRATGTCTRRSCSTRATRRRASAPRPRRRSCSTWRARSAGPRAASTGSGC